MTIGVRARRAATGEALPRALVDYEVWVERHANPSWLPDLGEIDIRLVETWQVYTIADDLTISVQLGRVDAEIHDFLGQFTDLVEAESDIFRYRISPQQLNQALEALRREGTLGRLVEDWIG